jgi:ATP-dependent RNA helicase DDX21
MNSGVDVLTGTPGRILDFVQSGTIDFSRVDHVVLDEVDRMLDMGFQDSVEDILKHIYTEERKTQKPQTLFFSATCPHWVKSIAKKYMAPDFEFIDLIGDSKLKTSTNVEVGYRMICVS